MSRFTWAPSAYRFLNGVLCLFKPEGLTVHETVNIIKKNLCRDLNALPCYTYEFPLKTHNGRKDLAETDLKTLTTNNDWLEHRLVLGDRYEESDVRVSFIDGLSRHSSGVLLLGLGAKSKESLELLALSRVLRVYHVKGRLGWATHNFSPKGKIIERTSYNHVKLANMEKICAATQAAHTKQMYMYSGISPDSQEAYEQASSGLIRPGKRKTPPILYGVKCIDFQPPDFTLEIHSINEHCIFLRKLIHDLALKLKTAAVCTGVRRLRYGHFTLDKTLLRGQWNLENIVDNVNENEELLFSERLFVGENIEQVESQEKLPLVGRQTLSGKG